MSDEARPGRIEALRALAAAGLAGAELLAAAASDLMAGVAAGEALTVEQYLSALPALAADRDAVLDLALAEFTARREAGGRPSAAEYAARFPDSAEELALQFQFEGHLEAAASPRPGEADTPVPAPLRGVWPAPAAAGAVPAEAQFPRGADFVTLRRIGAGSYGTVYLAHQLSLNRAVALKMLHPGPDAPDGPDGLLREARLAARMDHPRIVRVFQVGELRGRGFLALEYMEGGSLADWLAERRARQAAPLTPQEAARLVAGLADAVAYAHGRGVVHRDIKPGNVLLAGAPVGAEPPSARVTRAALARRADELDVPGMPLAKLGDFGLARSDAGSQSASGGRAGTPLYMAPEQFDPLVAAVGAASDIYALGVVLFELLTDRPPFTGTAEQVYAGVLHHPPAAPRHLRPSLPRDIETICLKCLGKRPEARYPSAAQLRDDLIAFANGEPIWARRPTPAQRARDFLRCEPWRTATGALVLLMSLLLGATLSVERERLRVTRELAEARAAADTARAAAGEVEQAARDQAERARRAELELLLGRCSA